MKQALRSSAFSPDHRLDGQHSNGGDTVGRTDSWFVARIESGPPGKQHRAADSTSASVQFSAQDTDISIRFGGSAQLATDDSSGRTLIIHGLLHDRPAENAAAALLADYARYGETVWQKLNGSFVGVLVDRNRRQAIVITDRLNSRRVYLSEDEGGWWLSSSLDRHPTEERSIDPAGVGSVLTSGTTHNGLTVFDGVRVLDRASVHLFSASGLHSKPYWSYTFTEENAAAPIEALHGELINLLRKSVERRLRLTSGPIFLSLSGGYDSRSIAGFLMESVDDPDRLHAVTYHHGARVGDTDASAAEQAARLLGIRHEVRPLYEGDIVSLIIRNARRGHGAANFCEEADFWESLGPELSAEPGSVLFTGDQGPGRQRRRLSGSAEEVLGLVGVYSPGVVEWFLEKMEPAPASLVREHWGRSFSEIVKRVPEYSDHRLAAEIMYVDERLSNTLMLWRECFQMPFVEVMSPYLDNDVMDFWRTLTEDHRDHKAIFIEANATAFPTLLELPIAKGGANQPDWGVELLAAENDIRERVTSTSSRLDDLISPDVILSLLDDGRRGTTRGRDSLSASARNLARRSSLVRVAVRKAKPRTVSAIPNRVSWQRLALRLLVLRESLTESARTPEITD